MRDGADNLIAILYDEIRLATCLIKAAKHSLVIGMYTGWDTTQGYLFPHKTEREYIDLEGRYTSCDNQRLEILRGKAYTLFRGLGILRDALWNKRTSYPTIVGSLEVSRKYPSVRTCCAQRCNLYRTSSCRSAAPLMNMHIWYALYSTVELRCPYH